MAKKSLIARNEKRRNIANLNYTKRQELKQKIKQGDMEAQRELSKMSRDSSFVRVRNRDALDGRPRAYMRKFGISRINFRKKTHNGEIPGVKKASW